MLAVIETHPIQYHAPVYRHLEQVLGVPVTAIYGSDFSTAAYRDAEFGATVDWATDLLAGYSHRFLTRAAPGETPDVSTLSARGTGALLRAIDPAAVLIVGYSPAFHRRAWYDAWRSRRPVLFRGETTDRPQDAGPGVGMVRQAGLRLAYRTCARVLYIGARSRAHYARLGVDASRLVFSPYCVDTTPFRPDETARASRRAAARAAWAIPADACVVMFAGKLSRRKGVDLLPPAMAALPLAIRARALLLCVGDGEERTTLEAEAARRGVPVRFLGVRRQEELSDAYHAADVLALPSRHAETWGLVVNEALHHGVPCVVSDRVGCGPDLVDANTGVVCHADSVAALAGALADAASRLAGRADVREQCRARVSRYSVAAAAEGLAEAYRAVAGRRAAA